MAPTGFRVMELIHAMEGPLSRDAFGTGNPRQIASPRASAAALRIAEMLAL